MALPAIEPAVEPTAEPMTLDQNPPPLDVAELINRLVDDGRVLLHNGRALRCIALRRSRTGERTTAAEASTATCFSCCRNEKGDRNGRHNSFLHR